MSQWRHFGMIPCRNTEIRVTTSAEDINLMLLTALLTAGEGQLQAGTLLSHHLMVRRQQPDLPCDETFIVR
jgi:hypothetical protein